MIRLMDAVNFAGVLWAFVGKTPPFPHANFYPDPLLIHGNSVKDLSVSVLHID